MKTPTEGNDSWLIDFSLGQLDEQELKQAPAKISADPQLTKGLSEVTNTLKALSLLEQVEPPDDLTKRTVDRIRQDRLREVLIVREQMKGHRLAPTFNWRDIAAVAAIVLVLGTVFAPTLYRARQRAAVDRCASNMENIGSALASFAGDNGGMMPAASEEPRSWLARPGVRSASNSAALYRLVKADYVAPRAFQCAAMASASFEPTPAQMDFPSERFVHYSYQHSLGRVMRLSDFQQDDVRQEMAILADSSPIMGNGCLRVDRARGGASDNHNQTGQNVLYLSGRVHWSPKPFAGIAQDNIYLARGVMRYRGDEQPSSSTDSFLLPAYTPTR